MTSFEERCEREDEEDRLALTYDRRTAFEQGYADAFNGFPRTSTAAMYRQGYDKGMSR